MAKARTKTKILKGPRGWIAEALLYADDLDWSHYFLVGVYPTREEARYRARTSFLAHVTNRAEA